MFGNLIRIFAPIIRIIMPLLRILLNPRYIIPLIVIWFHAPRPWRVIKDFFAQNAFLSGIFYGIMTAVSLILTYREGTLVYGFSAAVFPLLSVIFLLSHALFILIFCRIHYPRSKRINWRKTFEPIKDLFIVWGITVIFVSAVFLFILMISK